MNNNIPAGHEKEYDEEGIKLSAFRRVLRDSAKDLKDPIYIRKCMDEFMKAKLNQFPKLCREVRRVNYLKKKELAAMGNDGGWSESKNFKFDYSIPKELYGFMVNMVARDFWSEENEKIWRSFMDGIMAGEDAGNLLYLCKLHFDGNSESDKLTVTN